MKHYLILFIISFLVSFLFLTRNVDAKINDDDGATKRAYEAQSEITSISESTSVRCTTITYDHLLDKNMHQLQKIDCIKK